MNSLEYIRDAQARLAKLDGPEWAELWVNLRMDFHRKYCMGLIFSTRLSAEFFTITEAFLQNDEFLKVDRDEAAKGLKLGEYDVNYNKWLTQERQKLRQ